ncbi:MAG: metal-dependent transcriptional regulator [Bacilli bacterium]|jgi:DtxR family Mn-dependent transcriptional regulator
MRIRKSAEDYLETILILEARLGNVHAIDIASEMNFSKPSVSVAMKNLKEAGLITIDENDHISLTASGHKIADAVYERHVLLTDFFILLGVDEKQAEADACLIEHDLSNKSFQAIKKLYNQLIKNEKVLTKQKVK